MKIHAFVLAIVLSAAIAAPLEDGFLKALQPFYKNFHFRHRGVSTTTVAPAEYPQHITTESTPIEGTLVIGENSSIRPAIVPVRPAVIDEGGHVEQEEEQVTAVQADQQLENCCDDSINEQAHDHKNADGEQKEDDQEEDQTQNDQHDQKPADSQDSYSIVPQETTDADIPEEDQSSPRDPKEISRELQPPNQESSWPQYPMPELPQTEDYEPKIVVSDTKSIDSDTKGMDGDAKTVESEMESRDVVYKKPTYSRKDFIKDRKNNPMK